MPPDVAITLAEASGFLDPFVSEEQLRLLIKALRIPKAGARHTGRAGHPENTYDAAELLRLHSDVAPWLVRYG